MQKNIERKELKSRSNNRKRKTVRLRQKERNKGERKHIKRKRIDMERGKWRMNHRMTEGETTET